MDSRTIGDRQRDAANYMATLGAPHMNPVLSGTQRDMLIEMLERARKEAANRLSEAQGELDHLRVEVARFEEMGANFFDRIQEIDNLFSKLGHEAQVG